MNAVFKIELQFNIDFFSCAYENPYNINTDWVSWLQVLLKSAKINVLHLKWSDISV